MGFVNINATLTEGYYRISFCGHLGLLQLLVFMTAEPPTLNTEPPTLNTEPLTLNTERLTLNTEHKCNNHVQAAVRLTLQNGQAELRLLQKQLPLVSVLAITR